MLEAQNKTTQSDCHLIGVLGQERRPRIEPASQELFHDALIKLEDEGTILVWIPGAMSFLHS